MSPTNVPDAADTRFARLVERIDPHASLLRVWPLTGGVSAEVTAIEIEHPGRQREKLVVRRHGPVDLAANPNVAADEFALLRVLHEVGLPIPAPRYVDVTGELFGTPCIVIDFVQGTTNFAPTTAVDAAEELATQLARIHAIDLTRWDLSFLPRIRDRYADRLATPRRELDAGLDEGRIRDTLSAVWSLPERNLPALLHGDFWPGNALWVNGNLSAVIDWEDAAIGDPLADLANSRMEMFLMLGPEVMERFTSRYLSLTNLDLRGLPYWELFATLRPIIGLPSWGLDVAELEAMRARLNAFIAQAIKALDVPPSPSASQGI